MQLLGCRDSQAAGSGAVLAAGSARRKRAAKSAVVLLAFSVSFYYPRSLMWSSRTVGSFIEELLRKLFPLTFLRFWLDVGSWLCWVLVWD